VVSLEAHNREVAGSIATLSARKAYIDIGRFRRGVTNIIFMKWFYEVAIAAAVIREGTFLAIFNRHVSEINP
jgi:hypothetical protein